ncbi:hypothetical protein [Halovulum sp. GXIMD14793]
MALLASGIVSVNEVTISRTHRRIHGAPDRARFYAGLDDIEWSEELGAWMSATPEVIHTLLRHPDVEVLDFRQILPVIEEKTGVDLSGATEMFGAIALGMSGEELAAARREQMLILKQNTPAALDRFSTSVKEGLAHLLKDGGGNLVTTVTHPAGRDMMLALSGVDAETGTPEFSLSQIFDRYLSLGKRRRINAIVSEIISETSERMPRHEAVTRTALSVIGADSIIGALGVSFLHDAERNPGKRLSEFEWSPDMARTSVPYADRFAAADIDIAGKQIKKGDRLRLYYDSLGMAACPQHRDYYGIGAHVCLGKAISMRAWTIFCETLSRVDLVPQIERVTYRRGDCVFNFPTEIKMELTF